MPPTSCCIFEVHADAVGKLVYCGLFEYMQCADADTRRKLDPGFWAGRGHLRTSGRHIKTRYCSRSTWTTERLVVARFPSISDFMSKLIIVIVLSILCVRLVVLHWWWYARTTFLCPNVDKCSYFSPLSFCNRTTSSLRIAHTPARSF